MAFFVIKKEIKSRNTLFLKAKNKRNACIRVVTSIPAVIPILNAAGPIWEERKATQPIRIREPARVSDTVFFT